MLDATANPSSMALAPNDEIGEWQIDTLCRAFPTDLGDQFGCVSRDGMNGYGCFQFVEESASLISQNLGVRAIYAMPDLGD